jgi:hypothetical protein
VVDVLSRMLQKAARVYLIGGLGNDMIERGVVNLQYTYGTIIFVDKATNLKWILTSFGLMSGMRVNYHKNELVPINLEQGRSWGYSETYLGAL